MVGEITFWLVAISGHKFLKFLGAKQMKFCVWFEMGGRSARGLWVIPKGLSATSYTVETHKKLA